MARITRVSKLSPRRKKFQHFTMRFRHVLHRLSYTLNLITILYFMHEDGKLTYIYTKVLPMLEALLQQLPH